MYFGLTLEKVLLILLIAVLVVGPHRLPIYAAGLARFVMRGADFVNSTKSKIREELGPDFDDVDWNRFDPRSYDPRKILKDTLLDGEPEDPAPPNSRKPRP